jgi:hypothetical protein
MNRKTEILMEQEKKRFQQILEFTTFTKGYGEDRGMIDEDGDENQPVDDSQNQDPMMGGGDMPPMGGDMEQQGQDPMMGGDMEQQNQDPMMGGDTGNTPEGFNPQDNGMGGDITQDDFGGVGPDDEVVDITELTDAQDETNNKVKKLGFNLDKTFKQLEDFEKLINSTNEKIGELQREFEKRNPTQEEKLSARAAISYPFNVSPEDYWKEKEKTSNYSIDDDENGKEQQQYTITTKDIADTDWKSISDSMSINDILHQSIGNTLH